jgi:hypothetical protein
VHSSIAQQDYQENALEHWHLPPPVPKQARSPRSGPWAMVSVTVFERPPSLRDEPAGLTLLPCAELTLQLYGLPVAAAQSRLSLLVP